MSLLGLEHNWFCFENSKGRLPYAEDIYMETTIGHGIGKWTFVWIHWEGCFIHKSINQGPIVGGIRHGEAVDPDQQSDQLPSSTGQISEAWKKDLRIYESSKVFVGGFWPCAVVICVPFFEDISWGYISWQHHCLISWPWEIIWFIPYLQEIKIGWISFHDHLSEHRQKRSCITRESPVFSDVDFVEIWPVTAKLLICIVILAVAADNRGSSHNPWPGTRRVGALWSWRRAMWTPRTVKCWRPTTGDQASFSGMVL